MKLQIQFKKAKDDKRNALRMVRPDGSMEWSYNKTLVQHDLAHFVVESYFGITQGFYGEVLNGTPMATLESGGVTKAKTWHQDIFIAEALVGGFQQVMQLGEGAEMLHTRIMEGCGNQSIEIPTISDKEFAEVCARIRSLWEKWDQIAGGESLFLEFEPGANNASR